MITIAGDALLGWTVLVVEDEPDAAEIVQLLLMMHGATVEIAVNGRDGLEKARKVKPKFIIADLSMPEMSGWEMIERMQDDRGLASIPVVALTAHAMTGDREKAMQAGFRYFLTKPLHPETFVNDLLVLLQDDLPEARLILGS